MNYEQMHTYCGDQTIGRIVAERFIEPKQQTIWERILAWLKNVA